MAADVPLSTVISLHSPGNGWGTGQPVVFSHGWPLNADAWDDQAYFIASHGYRAIAHDRRGHGRSGQAWDGNDMDTYADDLAELIEALDLHDVVLVGHSTGGGEVPATSAATAPAGSPRPCW
jgi:non-heme chloroperoxidase